MAPTSVDRILGGCSKRRPDVYYDCVTHAVLVEIDENQHRRYDERCECVRLNEIFNDLGGLPMHVIRYNPDGFYIDGKKQDISNEERLKRLTIELGKMINNPPSCSYNSYDR